MLHLPQQNALGKHHCRSATGDPGLRVKQICQHRRTECQVARQCMHTGRNVYLKARAGCAYCRACRPEPSHG